MRKIVLRMDALAVASFATGGVGGPAGTVESREMAATRPAACDPFTLPPRCAPVL